MVQTSVDIYNNVNLDPKMCLRRGEGVYSFTEGLEKNGVLSLIDLFLLFKNIYIVQTMYIENNNKIYD